jgi:leucyl aminopeptidase
MDYATVSGEIGRLAAPFIVIPVQAGELTTKPKKTKVKKAGANGALTFSTFDPEFAKIAIDSLRSSGFKANDLQVSLIRYPKDGKLMPILLVGWDKDKPDAFTQYSRFRWLGNVIVDHAARLGVSSVILSAHLLDLGDRDALTALVEGCELSTYKFDRYKSKKNEKDKGESRDGLKKLLIHGLPKLDPKTVAAAKEVCTATALARDLINTPGSDCSPDVVAATCKKVAQSAGLKIDVWDKAKLKKMGAGGLIGVAQGSSFSPYLIRMVWKPKKKKSKVISIVGKGITFDSGGLSIKTAGGMEGMKMDMSGAAAVIATMQAIAILKPRVEVRAYIATAENAIGSAAMRPGDVLKAINGKTIEVLNTDAEGRLVLADALSLAEKDKCDVIIDMATLTGACVVALGLEYGGLFANDQKLSDQLIAAGAKCGERFWSMPLAPEYREHIKSNVADIKNTGTAGQAGSISAALFLKEFVSSTKWAHLDIAGPAGSDRDRGYIKKGGVGFGMRTLVRFIMEQ